jgi:hypothetical protein
MKWKIQFMFQTANQLWKPPFGFLKKGVQPPFFIGSFNRDLLENPQIYFGKKSPATRHGADDRG